MKKILVLLSLAFSTMAFANSTAIEGVWGASVDDNGFHFEFNFEIRSQQVVVSNTCSYQGKSVTARITSPSRYTENKLAILVAGQDQQSTPDKSLNCDVSMPAIELTYSIQGNVLSFSMPGSNEQMVLTRRGN